MFCNGSVVIFTCEIRGSDILQWRGDGFYVGDPITFAAVLHTVNVTRTSSSNPNTVATLTQNYLDDGDVRVLVSTLRIDIIAVSDSVRADGTGSRTDFEVLG